jgi:GntR family hexuronate regulon transcriptional repressor
MKSDRLILRSYARVTAKLKERIASGEFAIGARLPPERELATFYEVSRPTIRETMIALETEGFVSVRPGSGVYVISMRSRLSRTFEKNVDLFELIQARCVMESEACALAANQISSDQSQVLKCAVEDMRLCHENHDIIGFEHAERRFHLGIAEASGNAAVFIAIVTLWNIRPFKSQTGVLSEKIFSLIGRNGFNNYEKIIDSLKLGNGKKASFLLKQYYNIIIDDILKDMELLAIDQARAIIKKKRDRYSINTTNKPD